MRDLDALLRDHNPYYSNFRTMDRMVREAEERAANENVPFTEPRMYICHQNREERGRYNDPVGTAELAVIFDSADGQPLRGQHLRVYPTSGVFRELHCCDPNRDPMVYPLLFPFGEPGKF